MTENASQFVGDIPENYDRRLGPIIFEDYAEDLARRAAKLSPARTLELAAGTGIVSRKLKDALGAAGHLTVTDLNAPMLDVARAKFGDEENIEFGTADAMTLGFPDNHFDLVVCQFGVMFFPDKVASFREALRVLRPGGAYLFNCWGDLSENPFAQIAQDVAFSGPRVLENLRESKRPLKVGVVKQIKRVNEIPKYSFFIKINRQVSCETGGLVLTHSLVFTRTPVGR